MKIISLFLLVSFYAFSVFSAEVDLKATEVTWKGTKKLGDSHHGKLSIKSAKASLEEGTIKNAEFVIDMNKFTVDDLKGSWRDKFLNHMKGDDFFAVAKHPTATLKISEQKGNSVVGAMTIKGITHPVTIEFKKKDKTYSGKFKFDRTKYGIVYGSSNFFKKLVDSKIINNDIEISFKVSLK